MHHAKGEIEVIKFELTTLRSMQISARQEIAEAAARRAQRLQEELELLEAQVSNGAQGGSASSPAS